MKLLSAGCSEGSCKAYGWREPTAWEAAGKAGAPRLLLERPEGKSCVRFSVCPRRCLLASLPSASQILYAACHASPSLCQQLGRSQQAWGCLLQLSQGKVGLAAASVVGREGVQQPGAAPLGCLPPGA